MSAEHWSNLKPDPAPCVCGCGVVGAPTKNGHVRSCDRRKCASCRNRANRKGGRLRADGRGGGLSDGLKKRTCSPCLRGAHQLCTTPATCAHAHDKCRAAARVERPAAVVERAPVGARRSTGTSDRRLLERTYAAMTYLRTYTNPGIWNEELVSLYLDIESKLNQPRTGTIREPRAG